MIMWQTLYPEPFPLLPNTCLLNDVFILKLVFRTLMPVSFQNSWGRGGTFEGWLCQRSTACHSSDIVHLKRCLTVLQLADWARMAGQWGQGIHFPNTGVTSACYHCWLFTFSLMWVWISNSGPCASRRSENFTNWALSPAPTKSFMWEQVMDNYAFYQANVHFSSLSWLPCRTILSWLKGLKI